MKGGIRMHARVGGRRELAFSKDMLEEESFAVAGFCLLSCLSLTSPHSGGRCMEYSNDLVLSLIKFDDLQNTN